MRLAYNLSASLCKAGGTRGCPSYRADIRGRPLDILGVSYRVDIRGRPLDILGGGCLRVGPDTKNSNKTRAKKKNSARILFSFKDFPKPFSVRARNIFSKVEGQKYSFTKIQGQNIFL